MSFASDERRDLAALLLEVGPDAPTLCEGWRTRDLAAHLWVREREPWQLVSAILPGRSMADVLRRADGRASYERVVRNWATRPTPPNPVAVDGVDRLMNTAEHFVHHEDVRRAGQSPAEARALGPDAEHDLRQAISRLAPLLLAKSRVGVRLVDDQGRVFERGKQRPQVQISGPVGELVLFLFGRDVARVDVAGDPASVQALLDSLGV